MPIPIEAMDDSPSDNPAGYKSAADMRKMNSADLADYIEQCTSDYDGTSQSVRVAIVRLLRAINDPVGSALDSPDSSGVRALEGK